jgi:hypothetical protein
MSLVLAGLCLSGWAMYCLPAQDLPDMSDAQALLRRSSGVVHGVLAWFFGVLLGRGVWPHVRVMWHRQSPAGQWAWGVVNLFLLGALALGGLALLYGSADMHEVLSPWHFWTGTLVPAIYLAHTWKRFWPGTA